MTLDEKQSEQNQPDKAQKIAPDTTPETRQTEYKMELKYHHKIKISPDPRFEELQFQPPEIVFKV